MGLLEEDNFDWLLINIIKDYFKGKEVILIFDGLDSLGDKIIKGKLTVIYTPKDEYYNSADDKILEIAENLIKKDEIKIISDDRQLKEKLGKISQDNYKSFFFESAGDLAEKIKLKEAKRKSQFDESDELSQDEQEEINNDLLKIWK